MTCRRQARRIDLGRRVDTSGHNVGIGEVDKAKIYRDSYALLHDYSFVSV